MAETKLEKAEKAVAKAEKKPKEKKPKEKKVEEKTKKITVMLKNI